MDKEVKIVPPEGYEIDKENSTFECIKFKPIEKKRWRDNREQYVTGFFISAISKVMPFSGAREKAYSNCCDYTKDITINLLKKRINYWFKWENTPEGWDYWKKWFETTLSGINASQTSTLKEEKKEKSSARFKVGDKVFICLCVNKDYPFSYNSEMLKYNSKIATIIKVRTNVYSPENSDEDGCKYTLNIDGLDLKWSWSSPMLLAPPAVKFVESNIIDYSTLKLKSYESRLQEQETHFSGRDGAKSVRFCGLGKRTRKIS